LNRFFPQSVWREGRSKVEGKREGGRKRGRSRGGKRKSKEEGTTAEGR